LERAKQRVGLDLIARASQETATVVVANVIAMRGNRAIAVIDVFASGAFFQDRIPNLNNSWRAPSAGIGNSSAMQRARVPGKRAVA
jgi:hypothetical protein